MKTSHRHHRAAGKAVRNAAGSAVLLGSLALGGGAQAAITFNFDYSGNAAGVGFLDPTHGAARQAALTTAGNLFSNYFSTLFTNSATLNLGVTSFDTPLPGPLASAGTRSEHRTGFGGGEVVRQKLISGVDLNGSELDGEVNVNWGAPWELDPNTPVSTNAVSDFDFFAAIFHELTHALGFASGMNEAGSDGWVTNPGNRQGGLDVAGSWAAFDAFKTNCSGTNLIDHGTLLTNQPAYNAAKTSSMCFNGAHAMAANGGQEVALYAPSTYSGGSSGSHLDKAVFPEAMMKHDRDWDIDEARTFNAVEIGILTDLGYTRVSNNNPVPEPGSLALVLAAAAGLKLRRRKA